VYFRPSGRHEVQRILLRERTDEIWHSYLPEARPDCCMVIAFYGPHDLRGPPLQPNKLLIEPTPSTSRKHVWSDAHFGYRVGHSKADLSFDKPIAHMAPQEPRHRSRIYVGRRPTAAGAVAYQVIYEAHVRGMTMRIRRCRPTARTYAGWLLHVIEICSGSESQLWN